MINLVVAQEEVEIMAASDSGEYGKDRASGKRINLVR